MHNARAKVNARFIYFSDFAFKFVVVALFVLLFAGAVWFFLLRKDSQNDDGPIDDQVSPEVMREVASTPTDKAATKSNIEIAHSDLTLLEKKEAQSILLLKFYSDAIVEDSPVPSTLEQHGYIVHTSRPPLPPPAEFDLLLANSNQLWLWSSPDSCSLSPDHVSRIVNRWEQGRLGICLLADNTPFTTQASAVLSAVAPDSEISGRYVGQQFLQSRKQRDLGFVEQHPLFAGIERLYEGVTISHITGRDLKPLCFSSDGSVFIAATGKKGSSRLVVHGGYTSLGQEFWDDAGVGLLTTNIASWLAATATGNYEQESGRLIDLNVPPSFQ